MEIITKLEDRFSLLEIAEVRGKTLLDIGVGPLAMIAARDFSCHVTSVDVSDEALQKAREEAKKENIHINFEREDATDLSYGDNSFDVVISYATLHHIASLEARKNFVKEAYRVAREKVVIVDFNEAGFPHSGDEYKIVDFNWLENELKLLSAVEKYEGAKMNLSICFKRKQ